MNLSSSDLDSNRSSEASVSVETNIYLYNAISSFFSLSFPISDKEADSNKESEVNRGERGWLLIKCSQEESFSKIRIQSSRRVPYGYLREESGQTLLRDVVADSPYTRITRFDLVHEAQKLRASKCLLKRALCPSLSSLWNTD